jgi:hypothetical protein
MHGRTACLLGKECKKRHKGACIVVLEAVVDQGLWIWHALFGMVGYHNDINVLLCGLVYMFVKLVEGHSPLYTT